MYLLYYWGCGFCSYPRLMVMRRNHSSRFEFLSLLSTLWTERVFFLMPHTVAAWEQNSGNQFFFLNSVSYLVFCCCREQFSFYLHFQDNIPYHLVRKHNDCWGDMFSFFVLFLKKGKKKSLRSVVACDYAYSSQPTAADNGSCQVGIWSSFKTVISLAPQREVVLLEFDFFSMCNLYQAE